MLYDPKWEVKADPFSLEGLIAWLETMPARGTYCFTDSRGCLIDQWLKHIDPAASPGEGHSYMYKVHGMNTNFMHLRAIANGGSDGDTFGAALKRARAAL